MRDLTCFGRTWIGLVCALLVCATAHAGDGAHWTYLTEDDEIHIWKLEEPGKVLPGFRGKTVIKASIEEILAEMMDSAHHKDWMYRCKESRVLKELSDSSAVVYNRTDAPWPVWDRDVVLQVNYQFNADKTELTMKFEDVKNSTLKKKPEDVVRMPRLVGFYKMWQRGPKETEILYEVEADIGGSIPTWISKRAAKDLPYITLSRLRERVESRN